jgi:Ca2+-binding RTX toxin-like protein
MATKKPTAGNDTIVGTKAAEQLRGLSGDDKISGGGGNDRIYGDEGDDTLSGDDGNDVIRGGSGIDLLSGGNGNDSLLGEDGDDTLAGGVGDDALTGGAGADVMSGGGGFDQFEFWAFADSAGTAVDRITDYSLAQRDVLTLVELDANAAAAGYQFWDYVTQLGEFAEGGNGQATLSYDATANVTTLNLYNNDGDTKADFTVQFNGEYGAGDIDVNVFDRATLTFHDAIFF